MAWRPTASLALLQARAELYARIRQFFHRAGVLEVETPLLSSAANPDCYIDSFQVEAFQAGNPGYLHTSPEFAMKRLLAAYGEPIYQICKVFRQEERGSRHNPEFSMLEWYRPAWTIAELMAELESLIAFCAPTLAQASRKLTYFECFEQAISQPIEQLAVAELRQLCKDLAIDLVGNCNRAQELRDLLFSHRVEPWLATQSGLIFVVSFPKEVAALAKLKSGNPLLADRFELFIKGIEIANGYNELTDGEQLRERWREQNQMRQQQGRPPMPVDERLLHAMRHGLPESSGVALGLDRFLMLATEHGAIDQVISFPAELA